jgi:hypothetical protein
MGQGTPQNSGLETTKCFHSLTMNNPMRPLVTENKLAYFEE